MALRTLWRMDLTRDSRLKALQTPTLVLWGRDDKVNRPSGGPMLLNLMPNAELVMTSHTGHWMQWERAELFNQLVIDFLCAPIRHSARWNHNEPSVFGNVHLGYIVIETDKFADWRRFGRDAIGMHSTRRCLTSCGSASTTTNAGFCCSAAPPRMSPHSAGTSTTTDVRQILARVTGHGVPVTEGTAEEAALRGVERLVRFPGPNGLTQEIFTRARRSDTPLDMAVRGGFVTGEGGMGHVAVTSKKPHQMRGYYNTVFDARLTDYIDETISGLKFKIRFLRVNERHHTVAIAAVNRLPINPIRTRVQHLNIQVAELDDMTASYQRVKQLGFRHGAGASGQHTNDKELSYYAMTPSGFEWEVGWNPIVVDEKTWEPTTHQGISIWGHTPRGRPIIDKLSQFKTGSAVAAAPRGHRARAGRRRHPRRLKGRHHAANRHPSPR